MRRSRLLALAVVVMAGSMAGGGLGGRAQEPFPSSVVKLVVPGLAGSTTDTLARLTADQLSRKWAKPVMVENIGGGSMNIGAERVARSAPDGHTLMVAPPAPLAFNQLLYHDLGYDPSNFV